MIMNAIVHEPENATRLTDPAPNAARPEAGAPSASTAPAAASAPAAPAAVATPALAALLAAARHRQGARAAITAFDDDTHPVLQDTDAPAGQGARAKERRGRPRAAATAVLAAGGALAAQDLALLRAWAQGVPATGGARYLQGAQREGAAAARAAREHLAQLLERMAAAARELPDPAERERALQLLGQAGTALPAAAPGDGAAHGELGATTTLPLAPAPAPAPASAPPARARLTLEEFAARFDPDMYSEAELIELYEQERGGAEADLAATAPVPSAQQRAASDKGVASGEDLPLLERPVSLERPVFLERLALLERLAPYLAGRPSGRSLLAAWLRPPLAGAISHALDAPTVGALAERIAERGPAWWRAVPGLGRVRALRVQQWLAAQGEQIGLTLHQPAGTPAQRLQQGQAALAPLAQLAWPAHLQGHEGSFRGSGTNTLGAACDPQALAAWVRIHLADKSEATRRVYLRALERLVLWAICERQLALSSLTSAEFAAFRDFLAAPPAHWCGRERVVKGSASWRPLRGPLSTLAVMQVMGVVQQMWRDWHTSGYLRADAAALVPARPAAHACSGAQPVLARLDVTRAFDAQQLGAMREELAAMPEGPAQRRLRALVLLLVEAGLRRSEAQQLTFGAIEPLAPTRSDALPGAAGWQLRVVGKRGKQRLVPVRAQLVQALQAHWQDRLALARVGALPALLLTLAPQRAPVLGILRRGREPGQGGGGDTAAAAAHRANATGALAGASMHGLLKAFFARAAMRLPEGAQRALFARASAHWLRHTFAHRVVAAGGEQALPAAQALLGHASLATTGAYLRAQSCERLAALARVDSAF
jgi:site-specific recombinase XerD